MKGTFPRVTHPSATISFDLHVLGLPPAFVLSQNQTLKLSFDLTNHPLEYGRLLCCISISIAFFDENPFKQKEDRSLPDGKKNSQETHRRDRFGLLAKSASHHAACVSLPISYDVKQRGTEAPNFVSLRSRGPVRKWRLIQPPFFPSTTFFRSSAAGRLSIGGCLVLSEQNSLADCLGPEIRAFRKRRLI